MSQEALWSLDTITNQVILNDGNLLSIDSIVEYCAAYCDTARVRYNFDAISGRHIDVLDLFTPQGIVDLARTVQIQLENWMQEELKSTKNVDITYTKDPNYTEDPMTPECMGDLMTSMYKDCLKNDTGVFELESFLFEKNKITFYRQARAPHVIQAGDSIGEFSNTFTFKALVPYLSEYGKKLLFQNNSNQAHLENIFNKVLYGKIG